MKTIFSTAVLAICIAAQEDKDGLDTTIMDMEVLPRPDPERTCSLGDGEGCAIPPRDRDDIPDRLCADGDKACWERDAGKIDTLDFDDLPDRLCSDGQLGCQRWIDENYGEEKDDDDRTIVNIFDDFFNSAHSLKQATALFTIGAIGSATLLAF